MFHSTLAVKRELIMEEVKKRRSSLMTRCQKKTQDSRLKKREYIIFGELEKASR